MELTRGFGIHRLGLSLRCPAAIIFSAPVNRSYVTGEPWWPVVMRVPIWESTIPIFLTRQHRPGPPPHPWLLTDGIPRPQPCPTDVYSSRPERLAVTQCHPTDHSIRSASPTFLKSITRRRI